MARKPKTPRCEDCYFHRNLLCALELSEPCTTFRPDRPEGLVPPRQPVLLMRPPRWAAAQARGAGFPEPAGTLRGGAGGSLEDGSAGSLGGSPPDALDSRLAGAAI